MADGAGAEVADRLAAPATVCRRPTQPGFHGQAPASAVEEAVRARYFTAADIVNVIEAEEFCDTVNVVCPSFSGDAMNGAARHRYCRQDPRSGLPRVADGGRTARRRSTIFRRISSPPAGGRRRKPAVARTCQRHRRPRRSAFPMPAIPRSVKRRLTPHPFGTFTSPLNIKEPISDRLPRAYITCAGSRPTQHCRPHPAVSMRAPAGLALGPSRDRPRRHGDGAGRS